MGPYLGRHDARRHTKGEGDRYRQGEAGRRRPGERAQEGSRQVVFQVAADEVEVVGRHFRGTECGGAHFDEHAMGLGEQPLHVGRSPEGRDHTP